MFVNNHTCELVLLFGTNSPYECRNNWCLLSDGWYFTFLQSLFFLGWNYMCLGIEPLLDLSIFTAVDKVKDRILYNKVWKDNWTYWDTCQYYILYWIIISLIRSLLMLLLLYCFLFIWIDRNYFLLQAWPKLAYLWSHERFIIWWIYYTD
jgi:hypothetical protein